MSMCDRSSRLVNMALLVANGEALHNVSMSVYVYLCLSLSMSICDRSARLVNMAPLVANGEALHNGEIELYLQRNLGKHHGDPGLAIKNPPKKTPKNSPKVVFLGFFKFFIF